MRHTHGTVNACDFGEYPRGTLLLTSYGWRSEGFGVYEEEWLFRSMEPHEVAAQWADNDNNGTVVRITPLYRFTDFNTLPILSADLHEYNPDIQVELGPVKIVLMCVALTCVILLTVAFIGWF